MNQTTKKKYVMIHKQHIKELEKKKKIYIYIYIYKIRERNEEKSVDHGKDPHLLVALIVMLINRPLGRS